MAIIKEEITDRYALYNGDCVEVIQSLPDNSVDLSIHSPPFCGLYQYSSDERDMSNCADYNQFFEHYGFLVQHMARITKPGRIAAVHVMDIPTQGANVGGIWDFPGMVIKLFESHGFEFWSRRAIWKEPLQVRNRTMAKGLAHRTFCEDSTLVSCAHADYLLQFRKRGENAVPVIHECGLTNYAGERIVPHELQSYRGHKGKQTGNRYSHWIWRQYASSVWDDIRIDRVLPYREAREDNDERHVHPLQLDVIERCCVMWSNPDEVVFTPFMGVGSEVYGSVLNGRKGIGIELKEAYFNQAVLNLSDIKQEVQDFLIPMESLED